MVSVIIPVYNGAAFLEECLGSVLRQTYRDLEIIVIDDGSTDTSCEICRKLAAADDRIQLIYQENVGVSAARNRGLQAAKGAYITFTDADDKLPPAAVETLVKAAEAGADFVIGSHEEFRFGTVRRRIHNAMEISLLSANEIENLDELVSLMCGKLYKRSIMEANGIRFREGVPYGEDTMFNLRYCRCAGKMAVLGDVVYRCRLGGMASSVRYYPDRNRIAIAMIDAYCMHFGGKEHVPQHFLKKLVKDELLESVMHYMVHCPYRGAVAKVEETLSLFGGFPEVDTMDAQTLMKHVFQLHCRRIALRKIKNVFVRLFHIRI